MDAVQDFKGAMRTHGLTPPEIVSDGQLHRFSSNGRRGDDAGWYLLHLDGIPAGCFGDWRTGFSQTWRADIGRDLSPAEMAAHQARVDAARRAREAEEARRHAEAARNASSIWKTSTPASASHPYLARKQVEPVESLRDIDAAEAARILDYAPKSGNEDLAGRLLVVQVVKVAGELSTVEFIDEAGRKSALSRGAKAGGYWAAQALPDGDGAGITLLLAEGMATALSAREATGHRVIAALSSSNLLAVATLMRQRFPAAVLVILADLIKTTGQPDPHAIEAARAMGGLLAVPDFGENRPAGWTDFNDLHRLRGAGAVREAIENAKQPAGDQYGPGEETRTRIHHDRTVTLRELFEEPEESAQWLVEGLFPAAGFSVFAAKPKVGKSTLARQLALAVARGEPFLGRETTQGPVLYVALEEKRTQVRAHFRAMGAGGDESIHIYVASAPENAIAWLSRQIELVHPVLVIIDPLFRLARVRDASAYAEVTAAMEPLLGLARTTGAHVLVTHHATKRGEGTDAILGSTAIFGSVDTAAVLVRTERYRSIVTTQRYGEDLSETVLAWDPDTHTASLGGTREEAESDRLGKEILAYLSDKKEPVTEALIDEQIEGRTGPKKKALRVLVRDKRVTRTGEGKRGEPFLYISSFVVPTYTGEPGNQKPKDDLSICAAGGYSGSHDHADPGGSGNQQDRAKPDPGSWGTRI
jgi:phage/plasmid primase-like uncharacterized protein